MIDSPARSRGGAPSPLGTALRQIAEAEAGPHPGAAELAAYWTGGLAHDEVERLQDHLALCPQCAAVVRDLSGGNARPDPVRTAAWSALDARLAGAARDDEAAPTGSPPRMGSWPRAAVVVGLLLGGGLMGAGAWALWVSAPAATELPPPVAASPDLSPLEESLREARAGLDSAQQALLSSRRRVARLEKTLQERDAPRPNVPSLELYPEGYLRSDAGVARLEVPEGVELFVIRLVLVEPREGVDYTLEVRDDSGRVRWQTRELRPGPSGDVSLAFPRGFLEPGWHSFHVFEGVPEPGRAAGDYALELAYR